MITCALIYHLLIILLFLSFFFFFNDTATTEIYTLSLHDALPILDRLLGGLAGGDAVAREVHDEDAVLLDDAHQHEQASSSWTSRSEEHTSELQSQSNLVCRLLLEKKKKKKKK